MFTKELLAERLNGREYTEEITKDEESEAKASGLVVVFGGSDDLMEFRGSINEEIGAPCVVMVDAHGLVPSRQELLDDLYSERMTDEYVVAAFSWRLGGYEEIKANWIGGGEYCWEYETAIPHATFDIMEDGEKFCRGIVFDLPKKSVVETDAEDAKRYRFMRDRGSLQENNGFVVVYLKSGMVAEDGEDIQNSVFDAAIDTAMGKVA